MPETANHEITWEPDGHASSVHRGFYAITLPGFKSWTWALMREDAVATGVNGIGFETVADARRSAERALIEMVEEQSGKGRG